MAPQAGDKRKRKVTTKSNAILRGSGASFLATMELGSDGEDGPSRKQKRMGKSGKSDSESDAEPEWETTRQQSEWTEQMRSETALPTKQNDGKVVARKMREEDLATEEEVKKGLSAKARKRIAEVEKKEAKKKEKKEAEYAEIAQDKKAEKAKKAEDEWKKLCEAAETPEQKKRLMATVAQRITAKPEKEIELFNVFFHFYGMDEVKQIAILSAVAVLRDLIPSYRIAENNTEEGVKLSKQVLMLRKYEAALLEKGRRTLLGLDKMKKTHAHVAYRGFAVLLRAAAHFNFRDALINHVVKGATHADQSIVQNCCDALSEVIRMDATLEASKMIVNTVGKLVKQHASLTGSGKSLMRGVSAGLIYVLDSIRLDRSHDGLNVDAGDDELQKEIELGSIQESKKKLKRLEAEILTESVVVYLRVLRIKHLQEPSVTAATLVGLKNRAHDVNLELMVELMDEVRNLLDDLSPQRVPIALLALRCVFGLLQGPSAALDFDAHWVGGVLVETINLALPKLTRQNDVGEWPSVREFQSEGKAVEHLCNLIGDYIACKQLHQNRNSMHVPAQLLQALVTNAAHADAHIGQCLLRAASWLMNKYPRLSVTFEQDGALLNVEGSLASNALSLYWQRHALANHVSTVTQVCSASLSDAKAQKQLLNYGRNLQRPMSWLPVEKPEHEGVWPWPFLRVEAPTAKARSRIGNIPWLNAEDMKNMGTQRTDDRKSKKGK